MAGGCGQPPGLPLKNQLRRGGALIGSSGMAFGGGSWDGGVTVSRIGGGQWARRLLCISIWRSLVPAMDRGSLGFRGSHMTSTPFRWKVFSKPVEALLNATDKIVAQTRQLVSIGNNS
jgi:hypothetical protein